MIFLPCDGRSGRKRLRDGVDLSTFAFKIMCGDSPFFFFATVRCGYICEGHMIAPSAADRVYPALIVVLVSCIQNSSRGMHGRLCGGGWFRAKVE